MSWSSRTHRQTHTRPEVVVVVVTVASVVLIMVEVVVVVVVDTESHLVNIQHTQYHNGFQCAAGVPTNGYAADAVPTTNATRQ
jgi:hypothetical protein